ncbi:MAG: hypothetical protein ACM3OC_03155 [Deltaproteobacteria bacterium]
MIIVDFDLVLGLVFAAGLLVLAAGWAAMPSRRRTKEGGKIDPRLVWVCSVCTYNYVKTREEGISLCPRCGSYNKR